MSEQITKKCREAPSNVPAGVGIILSIIIGTGVYGYMLNYQTRIDKMGVVLNNGQIPLVKSRYMQYINQEQQID